MDYEKKYKEANDKVAARFGTNVAKEIFTDLYESEDERISKEIIKYLKQTVPHHHRDEVLKSKEWVAWLEKRGTSYTKRDVDDAYLKGVTDTKNETEKQYEANYQIRKDIATFIFNNRGDIKDRAKWMNYLGIKVSFVEMQSEQETLCDKCRKEHPSHSCQDITALGRCALEKQGEQAKEATNTHEVKTDDGSIMALVTDKVQLSKFKVGDGVVVSTTKGDRAVQIASIEYFKDGSPSYTTTEGRWFGNGTKARLLTYKDVETITLSESKVITYKDEEKQGEQRTACSEEDEDYYDAIIAKLEVTQDDAALTDNQMEFLKSLKDHVQPKQEWSEEDERMCQETIDWFEKKCFPYALESENPARESIKWLKSLKQRYTWKPSDEQMKALHDLNITGNISYAGQGQVLIELYNNLKKLVE